MVAYADLILPDTTYLERWDCISLLDRPISDADGAGRRDPPAGGRARPRRAAVPGRADRSRRAARTARLRHGGRQRRAIPAAIPTTSSITSARPASARWPAGAARTATSYGSGAPNPKPARRLHRQRLLLAARDLAPEHALLQARQPRLSRLGGRHGLASATPDADHLAALLRAAAEIPPRRARPRRGAAARPSTARASRPTSIRCRSGTRRSRRRRSSATPFRCTRSRSGRWRCTTPGARRTPGCARSTATIASTCIARRAADARHRRRRLGRGSTSHIGRVKGQVRLMDGVNPRHGLDLERDRQARRRLGPRRRRAGSRRAGFLLNHLISELLPERERRLSLLQQRSGHRPGRLVRSARAHREGRRRRRRRPRRSSRPCRCRPICQASRHAALRRRLQGRGSRRRR